MTSTNLSNPSFSKLSHQEKADKAHALLEQSNGGKVNSPKSHTENLSPSDLDHLLYLLTK